MILPLDTYDLIDVVMVPLIPRVYISSATRTP